MARIETNLEDGRTVTVTRAGATKRVHHSHGGVLTVRKDEAAEVEATLRAMGYRATLVDGSSDEPDPTADPTSPPDLPAPPPLTS